MDYLTWVVALAVTLAVGFVAANETDDWTQSADLQEVQLNQEAATRRAGPDRVSTRPAALTAATSVV